MASQPLPPPPGFDALFAIAAVLYGLYAAAELAAAARVPAADRARRVLLPVALAVHLGGVVLRGVAIEWFPLTNKFESFYGFALAAFAVLHVARDSASRLHRLALFAVGAAFYGWAHSFGHGLVLPPPLMITLWYPLHVPATFLAYALWTSAAGAGLAILAGAPEGPLRRFVEGHAFWGFCAFSVSMVLGGGWGIAAWGAYFLWDPKVVWSVILWLFWAGYVHLRYWPKATPVRGRAALAVVGFALLLVAYVGTSFLFANSSHSFR